MKTELTKKEIFENKVTGIAQKENKSKALVRLELKIAELESKENKTTNDFVLLANAKLKIENKSLSKVYKNVTSHVSKELQPLINDILGNSLVPTFEQFKEKMTVKQSYSNYDALRCLAKFNKKAIINTKLEKQNKEISKK